MARLKDLKVTIGLNKKGLSKLNADLRRTKSNMKRSFGEISAMATSVGKNMTAGLTAPLALFAANAVKTFASFEQQMAKVKAVSGAAGFEFDDLTAKAKELGASTRFTASQVAGLMLEYSKLGFSSDEIQKVTGATLALAQATDSDLATSATVAGSTLRAFGLEASETQRVVDVMAASFSSSALNMNFFADSMKFVAPNAKAAGVSIEQASAMLAVLANNGIKGSMAGTALRRILSEIAGSGQDFRKAMEKSANEVVNLSDAKDAVGRTAQSAFLVLKNGLKDIDALTVAYENAEGSAKSMAAIMDDTTEGAFKRMGSALEAVSISFGQSFAPIARKLADVVAGLAQAFSMVPAPVKNILGVLGILTAVAGPLILLGPQLIAAAQAFAVFKAAVVSSRLAMLALNPFFPLMLVGVTALAAGYVILNADMKRAQRNMDSMRKATNRALAAHKKLSGELKGKAATESTENLKKRLTELDEQLKQNDNVVQEAIAGADIYARLNGEAADQISRVKGSILANSGANKDLIVSQGEINKLQQERNVILSELQDRLDAVADSTDGVTDAMVEMGPAMEKVTEMNKGLLASDIMAAALATHELKGGFQQVTESVNGMHHAFAAAIKDGLPNFFMSAFDSIQSGMASFKEFMMQTLSGLLKKALALAAAFAVLSMLTGGATGVAELMGGKAGFGNFMKAGFGIPHMAEGGLFTGSSLAMVGEGPGTSLSNPEVVAPLDKLQSMMGGGNVNVTGVIRGQDILISNERSALDRNRVRGF